MVADYSANAGLPCLVFALDETVGTYWSNHHAPSSGLLQLLGLSCSEWVIILTVHASHLISQDAIDRGIRHIGLDLLLFFV